jgi:hypothetical protein
MEMYLEALPNQNLEFFTELQRLQLISHISHKDMLMTDSKLYGDEIILPHPRTKEKNFDILLFSA